MSGIQKWFVVLDEEAIRLLTLTHTKRGSPHVEEQAKHEVPADELEREEEAGHRQMRQSSGHSQVYVQEGKEREERLRRSASDFAAWLDAEVHNRALERVTVFAPDRMLGALRKQWPSRLTPRLVEQHGNYAHLSTGQLAEHDVIQQVAEA